MRPRLLLVLLALCLAVMSVAPAAAAPTGPEPAEKPAGADDGCGYAVTEGTPVLLGSLVDSVSELLPGRTTAAPFALSVGGCTGVRPGAMVTNDTGLCTFNYLFRGSDGRSYMGTAGHCVIGTTPGEHTWAPGQGPEAKDGAGNRVGEFAYAIFGPMRDFALVRLDPGVQANPQLCHFGGPTGVNNDLTSGPVVLEHFGQGVLLGQVVPGRTAVALDMSHPQQVLANGVAIFGDSGGAVNSSDGRAVGVLVTVGLHLGGIPNVGLIGVTRIGPQIAQAGDALGLDLQMVTAPRL